MPHYAQAMVSEADASGGDVNALAAALRSQGQDVSLYAGMLLNTLSEALPPELIEVERERGLRLFRRGEAPSVVAVTIGVGERRFHLRRPGPTTPPVATIEHVVRGIVLASEPVPLTEWSDRLARRLGQAAARDAGVARAIDALISGPR
jgi:hypothetical protein